MTTTSTSLRSSSSERADLHADVVRGGVHVRCSRRPDGDFHRTEVPFDELDARRRSWVDLPWTMLDEHHGTTVVRVREPGEADGAPGDAAVTALDGAVLGCWVGDCAPIVLVGAGREFAVVHAGWRGLAAGIVDRAIEAFSEPVHHALLGPSIEACCYEFGADDLAAVASGVHTDVATITGTTSGGRRALDVPGAVAAALAVHGLTTERLGGCTGCTFDGFSHRIRREPQRHVVAAWRPASPADDGAGA